MTTSLPFRKKVAERLGKAGRGLALLAALGLPTLTQAQTTGFPRNATFTGTDPGGFTLGGNAFLTATGSSATNGVVSGTPIDASGSGTLRLTNATSTPQQAGYAVDNSTFETPNGFSISFEFFAYGTNSATPADGFTVFLVDGEGTTPGNGFAIGGFGGSLGYAQRLQGTTIEAGITKGYLGIGIDEYGNFGIPSESKEGGYPGTTGNVLLPNAVSLRGPYNPDDPSRKTGYAYLAGSSSLGFNLAVGQSSSNKGSRITDPTNSGYRKAYINVIPVVTDGVTEYRITVRIQNGQNVTTAVNNYTVTNPPSTLRVGFAASTGGSNSIHEIRGLAVVRAPIAIDDQATTPYNKPIVIGILNNDQNGGGAAIAPGTVDLNANTIGRESSYTLPGGEGTITVDANGVATFTPSGTFAGQVRIPYTVLNQNSDLSNPGTIVINVTGADVATAINGPTSLNPGSQTSYSITTTNNGQETATNVSPTFTLPAGFTVVGALPAGATSSVINGVTVITFAQTTLASGESVINTINVQAPSTTGSYNLNTSYTYPSNSVVPDAVDSNNSSVLGVSVVGSANVAGVCSIPGKDGPATLDGNTIPNTYYAGTGTASKGSKTLTVNPAYVGSAPIAQGDLLLIVQMQGATMNTDNDSNYGTVSAATAGTYEYAVAASSVAGSGTLSLMSGLSNTYTYTPSTSTSTPFTQYQVIRIPQYSSLTVAGTVTGSAWNGTTGGILALEVAGTTTFSSGASLNMDGKGFRGGVATTTTTNGDNNLYATTNSAGFSSKGEGIAGRPVSLNSANSYDVTANGSYSFGKAATAGGGATFNSRRGNYGGGGGGANGGTGGNGVTSGNGNFAAKGGVGGRAVPNTSLLYLGGGGGAGASSVAGATGGTGGGIILFRTGNVSGTGIISANGTDGASNTYGAGGGGAGGTVALRVNNGSNNLQVFAKGGNGGKGNNGANGGGGGGGLLLTSATVKNTITRGSNGNGATDGTNTGATIGSDCLPALTTSLRTTTPSVTRSAAMQASYVYTVYNTGGGVIGLTAKPNLAAVNGSANLFTYANMSSVVIQFADGTTQTLAPSAYTVSNAGTSQPTFSLNSNVVLPAGASIAFTFVANISSTATNGTAYGSNGETAYLDPTRTTSSATAYAGGYTSSNGNSGDVVTIVAPLPVKLVSFTATAVGSNAVLNWETAQEVNNNRFEVERSLDGYTFERVGTVAGKGNTMYAVSYNYTDANAHTANMLYYRLRQVDEDGTASFSQVRTVQFHSATAAGVSLYPNPAASSVTLDLSTLPTGNYTVQVFETTGRLVQSSTYQAGKQTLSLEGLATGTYFVKVQGTSFNTVLPFIKQ